VALHGAELQHRLIAAAFAFVVHGHSFLYAAIGKVLSFTYLIKPKPNRMAVFGFSKPKPIQVFEN